jgi:hypothetical protein
VVLAFHRDDQAAARAVFSLATSVLRTTSHAEPAFFRGIRPLLPTSAGPPLRYEALRQQLAASPLPDDSE